MSQIYKKSQFQLQVRPLAKGEEERWKSEMAHHYLGCSKFVGEQIKYVAIVNNQWVALLIWTQGVFNLEERDEWIGWYLEQKKYRSKYVANNNRYLILPGVQIKNLASAILTLNTNRLSLDWQSRYGHPILLAETFVDPQKFSGSCYRACGFKKIGLSKGFSLTTQGYIYHGNKKIILVKPLHPQARSILGGLYTHPLYFNNSFSFEVKPMMNLEKIPLYGANGLIEFAKKLPDGRSRHGRRHRTTGMMILCLLAVMSGAKTFKGIALWAKSLPAAFREKIELWQIPSESTVRRFLITLNTEFVDQQIYQWLGQQESLKGLALALDGKTIKRSGDKNNKNIQLLSVITHDEGLVVAQAKINDKTNEIPVAREIIHNLEVKGSVITADALHSQTETAEVVKKNGADYVFIIKENQKGIQNEIKSALNNPCFKGLQQSFESFDKAHGRIEMRKITVLPGCPMEKNLPHAAQAFQIERTRMSLSGEFLSSEIAYGLTSLHYTQANPERILEYVRGHWHIENKLHYIRDVVFDEDYACMRSGHGAQLMATLRNLAINIFRRAQVAIKESVSRCGWDRKYLLSFFNWKVAVVQ